MPQFVAFIRAINVAGHAAVSMTALREAFEAAGCLNVRTVIQSGNVLFDLRDRAVAPVLKKFTTRLRTVLGSEPEIVIRAMSDIGGLVQEAPFTDRHAAGAAKLYVTFLSKPPRRAPALPLISTKEAVEAIAMTDREVFIVSRRKKNGFFGFPNAFVEQALGVSATSRNWSTVKKIAALGAKTR